jgi:hypothetical protein
MKKLLTLAALLIAFSAINVTYAETNDSSDSLCDKARQAYDTKASDSDSDEEETTEGSSSEA